MSRNADHDAPIRTSSKPTTILIVEESESLQLLLALILEPEGYQLVQASTGAEAQRWLDRTDAPVHLLLIDVDTPDIFAPELAEILQRSQPKMKVLFLTSYTAEVPDKAGIPQTDPAYLRKPFLPSVLLKRVRERLREGS